MWSIPRSRCFKGNIGSSWYELKARNDDWKALDAYLFLCFGQKSNESIILREAKKSPKFGFLNSNLINGYIRQPFDIK